MGSVIVESSKTQLAGSVPAGLPAQSEYSSEEYVKIKNGRCSFVPAWFVTLIRMHANYARLLESEVAAD